MWRGLQEILPAFQSWQKINKSRRVKKWTSIPLVEKEMQQSSKYISWKLAASAVSSYHKQQKHRSVVTELVKPCTAGELPRTELINFFGYPSTIYDITRPSVLGMRGRHMCAILGDPC